MHDVRARVISAPQFAGPAEQQDAPLSSSASAEPSSADHQAHRALEAELAAMIVDVLNLEIQPAEIEPEAPLFREGLGLDSIDALELALTIAGRYGVNLRADDAQSTASFASLRSLAEFIAARRPG
jgi:acyl carrier protein